MDASTVSRALKGGERVAVETQREVRAAARRLGYVPNSAARMLRHAATKPLSPGTGIVAFVMARHSIEKWKPEDQYKSRLFAAIHREVARRKRLLLVHGYDDDDDVCCRPLIAAKVDGVLGKIDSPAVAESIGRQVPLVLVQTPLPSASDLCAVNTDLDAGVWLVLNHLAGLGHRRVAWFRPIESAESESERLYATLARVLPQFDLTLDETLGPRSITPATHSRVMAAYAGEIAPSIRGREITAIVCPNDVYAFTLLGKLRELGVRVPEDCSITGFDERTMLDEGRCTDLTTVAHPFEELVATAMHQLDRAIRGESLPAGQMLIRPTLLPRASTGPAPSGESS